MIEKLRCSRPGMTLKQCHNRSVVFGLIALASILLLGSVESGVAMKRQEPVTAEVAARQSQTFLNDLPSGDQAAWRRVIDRNPLLLIKLNSNPK